VAEMLTDGLRLPNVNDSNTANDFLDELWKRNSIYKSASSDSESKSPRNLRQNHMLFQSLADHTRDNVLWKDLDEWKQNWNASIGFIKILREESLKMINYFLTREESTTPSATNNINKYAQHEHPLEKMAEGILKILLQMLENGKSDFEGKIVRIRQQALVPN